MLARTEKGFTLIEFMIAMSVLSISLLAYASALPTAVQIMHRTSSYSEAISLTQQRLETIRNLSFANVLAAGGAQTVTGAHATTFTVTTSVGPVVGGVVVATGAAPNRFADVTVATTWVEQGQPKSLRLAVIVAEF